MSDPATDETTLVCLHGMACTGRVWDGFREAWSHGPVLTPDLAGHGSGPKLASYGLAGFAEEVAERIAGSLSTGSRVAVIGHSLGGAIGVQLASRELLPMDALFAIGIKTDWSDEELAGTQKVADKGVRWFDDRAEAEIWFLKVSGLFGLVEPGSEIGESGIVQEAAGQNAGQWRLATDPEAFRNGPMDFAASLAAVQVPLRLARGAEDAMVPPEQVAPYDAGFIEFPGAGHSAHVEQPAQLAEAVWEFLQAR